MNAMKEQHGCVASEAPVARPLSTKISPIFSLTHGWRLMSGKQHVLL